MPQNTIHWPSPMSVYTVSLDAGHGNPDGEDAIEAVELGALVEVVDEELG